MDGKPPIRVDYDPPLSQNIDLPNSLIEIVDSDHARDNSTRRSCHCVLSLRNRVVVHWKMQQQKCIALHSTNSKIRGGLAAAKEGLYLQDICAFAQLPVGYIRPLPIYADSQPMIDSLNANTVTTRVKHIAVPIHFTNQQIKNGRVTLRKIGTQLNLADSGTKPNPSLTHFCHFTKPLVFASTLLRIQNITNF